MIITINTKEDSKEEIRKAIQMLMKLIEEMPAGSTDFAPVGGEGIFGIFDNPASASGTSNPEVPKEPEEKMEIYDY